MNESLKRLARLHNISIHRSVTLKSHGTGLGLFMQNDVPSETELLRIPLKSIYDIYSTEDHLSSSSQDLFKQWIRIIVRDVPFITENDVLFIQILAASIMNKNHSEALKCYTKETLMKTSVDLSLLENLPTLIEIYEFYPKLQVLFHHIVKLFKTIGTLLPEDEFSPNCLRQLYSAVTSRSLEIPYKINQDESFGVRTTLVPVLDFVNHDNGKKNAYYDLDLEENALVLKTLGFNKRSDPKSEVQIFISYDAEENLMKFIPTYGFAPDIHEYQTWEYSLNRVNLKENFADVRKIYQCFDVIPSIQFVKIKTSSTVKWLVDDTNKSFESLLIPFIDGKTLWVENSKQPYCHYIYSTYDKDLILARDSEVLNEAWYAKNFFLLSNDDKFSCGNHFMSLRAGTETIETPSLIDIELLGLKYSRKQFWSMLKQDISSRLKHLHSFRKDKIPLLILTEIEILSSVVLCDEPWLSSHKIDITPPLFSPLEWKSECQIEAPSADDLKHIFNELVNYRFTN